MRYLAALLLVLPLVATAALPDEMQVYTDELTAKGETGVEVHINTTPSGRSTPEYPGEVVPRHGLRITPEFAWGLGGDWDWGFYLPTTRSADGSWYVAGTKLRLKWLPVRHEGSETGWFAGINGELSRVAGRFEQSRTGLEIRNIIGYRGKEWLFAANPVLGWQMSDGLSQKTPDFSLQLKLNRELGGEWSAGLETYSDFGPINAFLPNAEQSHSLFAVVEYGGKPVGVHFGIGRGLNNNTDKWTLKAILDFSF